MDDDNLHSQPARSLIRSWQTSSASTVVESNYSLWDVALGGALFVTVLGAWVGSQAAARLDVGGAMVIALAEAYAGTLLGVVAGVVVGLIGRWLTAKLGIESLLRSRGAGRLDQGSGRVLYAGTVGALGGAVIQLLLQIVGLRAGPWSGLVGAMGTGLFFWLVCAIVGAGTGIFFTERTRSKTAKSYALLGGGIGAVLGIVAGFSLFLTSKGALVLPALMLILITALIGAGIALLRLQRQLKQ